MTTATTLCIRPATADDQAAIWAVIEPAVRSGETLALDRDIDRAHALSSYWLRPGNSVYAAVMGDQILGSYFLRANQAGGGAHICNAGYATADGAKGKGVGRAMCEHSIMVARERGFHGMQFNFVVSTNDRAMRLWRSCGFDIVGTIPHAFRHPEKGLVDAFVMYQSL